MSYHTKKKAVKYWLETTKPKANEKQLIDLNQIEALIYEADVQISLLHAKVEQLELAVSWWHQCQQKNSNETANYWRNQFNELKAHVTTGRPLNSELQRILNN